MGSSWSGCRRCCCGHARDRGGLGQGDLGPVHLGRQRLPHARRSPSGSSPARGRSVGGSASEMRRSRRTVLDSAAVHARDWLPLVTPASAAASDVWYSSSDRSSVSVTAATWARSCSAAAIRWSRRSSCVARSFSSSLNVRTRCMTRSKSAAMASADSTPFGPRRRRGRPLRPWPRRPGRGARPRAALAAGQILLVLLDQPADRRPPHRDTHRRQAVGGEHRRQRPCAGRRPPDGHRAAGHVGARVAAEQVGRLSVDGVAAEPQRRQDGRGLGGLERRQRVLGYPTDAQGVEQVGLAVAVGLGSRHDQIEVGLVAVALQHGPARPRGP